MNVHKGLLIALFASCAQSIDAGISKYNAEEITTGLKVIVPGAAAALTTSIALSAYFKPEIISSSKNFMSFIKNPFYLPLKQRLIIAPFVGLACGLVTKASASYFLASKK